MDRIISPQLSDVEIGNPSEIYIFYSRAIGPIHCIQYVYMGFSRSLCSSNIFLKEPALGSRFSFKFVMNDDDKIGSP